MILFCRKITFAQVNSLYPGYNYIIVYRGISTCAQSLNIQVIQSKPMCFRCAGRADISLMIYFGELKLFFRINK